MTVVRLRATTFTGSAHTNQANAVDAGDGTYATWTSASRNANTTGTFGGFNTSLIPAGSTINSVKAEMRHYESSTSAVASVTVAGTAITKVTAAAVASVTLPASVPSTVAVVSTRGNNTTSTTCYIDWLELVVDYTAPAVPTSGAWNGTAWRTPEVWNGTRWVVPEIWNGTRWVTAGGT